MKAQHINPFSSLITNAAPDSDGESSHSAHSFFESSTSSESPHLDRLVNLRYKMKWERLKRAARNAIFENSSLCDEVSHVQEKILITKEERRFLLKKLLSFEGHKELLTIKSNPTVSGTSTSIQSQDSKPKKKNSLKKKSSKDLDDHGKSKSKRKKSSAEKKLVPPIPLDSSSRPVFPILLGTIRIHSLGEIAPDRPGFHTEESIFPVGFCSSRFFVSFKDPNQCCLYTCTVMDQFGKPRFEIMAEDDPDHPLVGSTATDCHSQLLQLVNKACGREVVPCEGNGIEFFGFYHPVVQSLIQNCPGARKCLQYRWVKFEINKTAPLVTETVAQVEVKPYICFATYQQLLATGSTSDIKPIIKQEFLDTPSRGESPEDDPESPENYENDF